MTLDRFNVPESRCPYLAEDKCSSDERKTCCERVATDGAAPQIRLSIVMASLLVPLNLLLSIT